jgi:hypothetical protein
VPNNSRPAVGGRTLKKGGAIELDISQGELVEAELDAFIARQDTQRRHAEGERPEEALWRASERRYQERQRREIRALWYAYFCKMASNHTRIAADYERRAEELCEEGAA